MKLKHILILSMLVLLSCSGNNNVNIPEINIECYKYINSIHTSLGVPCDLDTTDDYLIIRPQYVLSYNKNRNVCNWVAWELNSSWFGPVDRYSGNFITDTSLPSGYYGVKHSDYTNSGYDRGHMVMSEERTATEADNISTFILSNILPQQPDLNRGVWLKLETYCNDLCREEGKELFIYAGGIFHSSTTIGNGVAVPDSCFKIVVVLDKGQGLNNISSTTQVIAVVMPNISGISNDEWSKYKTTVRRIENSTGYNFLSSVKKSIQDVIEVK